MYFEYKTVTEVKNHLNGYLNATIAKKYDDRAAEIIANRYNNNYSYEDLDNILNALINEFIREALQQ